jgi:hypothetical protein
LSSPKLVNVTIVSLLSFYAFRVRGRGRVVDLYNGGDERRKGGGMGGEVRGRKTGKRPLNWSRIATFGCAITHREN